MRNECLVFATDLMYINLPEKTDEEALNKLSNWIADSGEAALHVGNGVLNENKVSSKKIPIDNVAAINVTLVNDLVFSDSSFELEIDGLFTANDETVISSLQREAKDDSNSCEGVNKMIWISLHEKVLDSAVSVYFEADMMQWFIDQLPDQFLLNTAGWKHVIPQLYKKFPNDDMKLNISTSSPPTINIQWQNIDVIVDLDMTVYVVDSTLINIIDFWKVPPVSFFSWFGFSN
ncbi:putative BPI/LBP family protein At1g04970 [Apium graveolens]|uniref:putative BPI/LBP family protein At1g04970 n=1 Tax=Apium graveolens TaxID=4045 RepID=UPI003D78ED30